VKTKLSHSQISKYQQCPKSYEYHYVRKLRSTVTSAALVFGSALDNALNVLLTEGDLRGAEVAFEKSFRFHKINDVDSYIPTCVSVVYANTDFDSDLLTEDDYNHVKENIEKWNFHATRHPLETYKTLRDKKQEHGFDGLSFEEKRFFNLMNWLSSRRKGLLMLAAYIKKVLPKIEKVHAIQEYVSLNNEAGDKIIGYVDLIADVKGIGTVILDNKTSGREYEEDSVLTSIKFVHTHPRRKVQHP
jgi:hypothetical protein